MMRAVLDAIAPPGDLWRPVPGGAMDHLYDGMADNAESVRVYLGLLDNVRDPYSTPYLADLEKEFGITPNPNLTTAQRIATLATRKFRRTSKGGLADLQTALNNAGLGVGGYGIRVFANDPPVNPAQFTSQLAQAYMGQTNSVHGNQNAFCALIGGFYIVNGVYSTYTTAQFLSMGQGSAFHGFGTAVMGYFQVYNQTNIVPASPPDPWSWASVFFIAASVTNAGAGITAVTFANLPSQLKDTFYEIVLRYKPLGTWAACMVNFT